MWYYTISVYIKIAHEGSNSGDLILLWGRIKKNLLSITSKITNILSRKKPQPKIIFLKSLWFKLLPRPELMYLMIPFWYQAELMNSAWIDEMLCSFADGHVHFYKTLLNVIWKSAGVSAENIFFFFFQNSKSIRISCCWEISCSGECWTLS